LKKEIEGKARGRGFLKEEEIKSKKIKKSNKRTL